MKIPLVISAFDRDACLSRLLQSLRLAVLPSDLKLIISIDGGAAGGVIRTAEEFAWDYGEKELIYHEKNLGLRDHMLFCCSLSSDYDGVVVLEDDVIVSKHFYRYAHAAALFYAADEHISAVSLYSLRTNETTGFPFRPIQDGFDCFFMQAACTWGHCWLSHQWETFRHWYEHTAAIGLDPGDERIPPDIRSWPQSSLKKYITTYLAENDRYFVYPRNSYTSNVGDSGIHQRGTSVFQVPLQFAEETIRFVGFDESEVKYDAYSELLPSCLKRFAPQLEAFDFDVDLFGMKTKSYSDNRYIITSKPCREPIRSFGRVMKPPEMNIICDYPGTDMFLADKNTVEDYTNYKDRVLAMHADYAELYPYYFSIYPQHLDWIQNEKVERASLSIKNSWTYRLGNLLTKPVISLFHMLDKKNG